MKTKLCSVCKDPKSVEDFNKREGASDGLQGKCRECSRKMSKAHYEASPGYYQAKAKFRREDLTLAVTQLKQDKPCLDCGGVFHPVSMDFDHRDGETKIGSVSSLRMSGWSFRRILEEVSKCDLVCANCHRVRTLNRYKPGETNLKSSKTYR